MPTTATHAPTFPTRTVLPWVVAAIAVPMVVAFTVGGSPRPEMGQQVPAAQVPAVKAAVQNESAQQFRDLAPTTALQADLAANEALMSVPQNGGLQLAHGDRIVSIESPQRAIVAHSNGQKGLVEAVGGSRIAVKDASGNWHRPNLKLRKTDAGFEPRRAAEGIVIPATAAGAITAGKGVAVQLDGTAPGQTIADGAKVFYPSIARDTDAVVEAAPTGVAIAWMLRSSASPERLRFDLGNVPAKLAPNGDLSLGATGELGAVSAPIAVDADSVPVKARFDVTPAGVFVVVDHVKQKVRYPISVDPTITTDSATSLKVVKEHGATSSDPLATGWQFDPGPGITTSTDSSGRMSLTTTAATQTGNNAWLKFDPSGESSAYKVQFEGVQLSGSGARIVAGIWNAGAGGWGDSNRWDNLTSGASGTASGGAPAPFKQETPIASSQRVQVCSASDCGASPAPSASNIVAFRLEQVSAAASTASFTGAFIWHRESNMPNAIGVASRGSSSYSDLPAETDWYTGTKPLGARFNVVDSGVGSCIVSTGTVSPAPVEVGLLSGGQQVSGVAVASLNTCTDSVIPVGQMKPGSLFYWNEPSGSLFPDGQFTLQVTGRDAVGNARPLTRTLKIDRHAPEIKLPAGSSAAGPARIAGVALTPRATGDTIAATPAVVDSTATPSVAIDLYDQAGVSTVYTRLFKLDADGKRVSGTGAPLDVDGYVVDANGVPVLDANGQRIDGAVTSNVAALPGPTTGGSVTATGNGAAITTATAYPGLYELFVTAQDQSGQLSTRGVYDFRVALPAIEQQTLDEAGPDEACLEFGRALDAGHPDDSMPRPIYDSIRNGAWDAGAIGVLALDAMRNGSPTGGSAGNGTNSAGRVVTAIKNLLATGPGTCAGATHIESGAASHEPNSAGGYSAQYELWATGAFTLARYTPAVWTSLTTVEQKQIDLIMEASLVANAFLLSDYTLQNTTTADNGSLPRYAGIDGDKNVFTDQGGNMREGMVAQLLVAAAYFGPANASTMLDSWRRDGGAISGQPDSFLTRIRAVSPDGNALLGNIKRTFTQGRDSNGAPLSGTLVASDARIEDGLHRGQSVPDGSGGFVMGTQANSVWTFGKLKLTDIVALYSKETLASFRAPVGCGARDTAGGVTSPAPLTPPAFVQLVANGASYGAGRVADPVTGSDLNTEAEVNARPLCAQVLSGVPKNTDGTVKTGTGGAPAATVIDLDTTDGGCGDQGNCLTPSWCTVKCRRSSLIYALMTTKSNQFDQLVLSAVGQLPVRATGSTDVDSKMTEIMNRKRLGVEDVLRKLSAGYVSYSRGHPDDVPDQAATVNQVGPWRLQWTAPAAGAATPTPLSNSKYRYALRFTQRLWCGVLNPAIATSGPTWQTTNSVCSQ